MKLRNLVLSLVATTIAIVPFAVTQAQDTKEQFFPALVYRTGPYAAGGSGFWGGMEDYMALMNLRDGGVNGVMLKWEECETAYNSDRGVECYERLKNQGERGATVVHPLSTGITYRLIERATTDKIPLISMGYGRTDASNGKIFPWVFPLITNYWSQNTAKIKYIGMLEGGMENLKGKKIANLHHDGSYGKETEPVLEKQAEMYGFEIRHYPVAHPGLDQKAAWLDISRRYKPDWVILRGWGVMNPTALKEAARTGFPADRIVGIWWSGAEEDVIPAGKAADGYVAAGFHPSGSDFPLIQEILDIVHGAGKGNISPQRVGTIYYNRGIVAGIVTVEAMRTAQAEFGDIVLSGEEMRWGLENLNISAERIAELGADGLMAPLTITCADHEGGGPVKFSRWDAAGKQWVEVTDWIATDKSIVDSMIMDSSMAYAAEKGLTPRSGMSMGSDCG